jgi:hypothetical protein
VASALALTQLVVGDKMKQQNVQLNDYMNYRSTLSLSASTIISASW